VVTVQNKEYNTNQILRSTTLSSIGLVSGRHMLRLRYTPTDISLAEFVERDSKSQAVEKVAQEQAAEEKRVKKAAAIEKGKKAALEREERIKVLKEEEQRKKKENEARQKVLREAYEKEQLARAEKEKKDKENYERQQAKKALQDAEKHKALKEREMQEQAEMQERFKLLSSWGGGEAKDKEDTTKDKDERPAKRMKLGEGTIDLRKGDSELRKTTTKLMRMKTEKERERDFGIPKEPCPRCVQVFAASTKPFNVASIEVPEDFYHISSDDMKKIVAAKQAEKREEQQRTSVLMTKEMRERKKTQQLRRFRKTYIRVRFPNRMELQATFWSTETNQHLIDFVKSSLANPELKFYLYTTPPPKHLDAKANFKAQRFLPAALVHFGLEQGETVTGNFLKQELLDSASVKLPPPSVKYVSAADAPNPIVGVKKPTPAPSKKRPRQATDEKKKWELPTWFKLGQKK